MKWQENVEIPMKIVDAIFSGIVEYVKRDGEDEQAGKNFFFCILVNRKKAGDNDLYKADSNSCRQTYESLI